MALGERQRAALVRARQRAGGSAVGGSYSAWNGTAQPDDSGGQDCAAIDTSGKWDDATCTNALGFVCEVQADLCPSDPQKAYPGQCGCGTPDTDSDADGTANCNDGCPNHAAKPAPGVCGCSMGDTDNDGTEDCNETCRRRSEQARRRRLRLRRRGHRHRRRRQADCNETCDDDPNKLAPGACGCGVADTDSDDDGTPNCNETCDLDPNKLAAGVCGCGSGHRHRHRRHAELQRHVPEQRAQDRARAFGGCATADTDSDNDGTPNCNDLCPSHAIQTVRAYAAAAWPRPTAMATRCRIAPTAATTIVYKLVAGMCGCGNADTDSDDDGYADCIDNCDGDKLKQDPGACGCGLATPTATLTRRRIASMAATTTR